MAYFASIKLNKIIGTRYSINLVLWNCLFEFLSVLFSSDVNGRNTDPKYASVKEALLVFHLI